MLRQIKALFLSLVMSVVALSVTAQTDQPPVEATVIDSLYDIITKQTENRLRGIQYRLQIRLEEQQGSIDSLNEKMNRQYDRIRELEKEKNTIHEKLELTEDQLFQSNRRFEEEQAKIKRLLYISGPSILILILISVVLFFILYMKQQEQTDRQLNALRKYTHSEIEETRSDLLKNLKKRLKEVRAVMGKKQGNKMKGNRKK